MRQYTMLLAAVLALGAMSPALACDAGSLITAHEARTHTFFAAPLKFNPPFACLFCPCAQKCPALILFCITVRPCAI